MSNQTESKPVTNEPTIINDELTDEQLEVVVGGTIKIGFPTAVE